MKIIIEINILEKDGKFKPQISLLKNDENGGESQEITISQWSDTQKEAEDCGKLIGKEEAFKKYGKDITIGFLLK